MFRKQDIFEIVLGVELFDLFKNFQHSTTQHDDQRFNDQIWHLLLLAYPKTKDQSRCEKREYASTPNRVKHDPRLHVQLIILSRIGYLVRYHLVCVAIAGGVFGLRLGVKKFVSFIFLRRSSTHNFINTVKVRLNQEIGFLSLNLVI